MGMTINECRSKIIGYGFSEEDTSTIIEAADNVSKEIHLPTVDIALLYAQTLLQFQNPVKTNKKYRVELGKLLNLAGGTSAHE